MSQSPWWVEWPERREYELAALRAAGITFEVNKDLEKLGVLQLDVTASVPSYGNVELTATYPDNYPYFRPVARFRGDSALDVGRHVHPFGGGLCFLGRREDEWWPDDTLATLLVEQLPKVLATSVGDVSEAPPDQRINALEQNQAEPFSEYYTCYAAGAVLMDSAWRIDEEVRGGTLSVAARVQRLEDGETYALIGAVLDLRDAAGAVLATFEGVRPKDFEHVVAGRWVRVDQPIIANSAPEIYAQVAQRAPSLASMPWERLPSAGTEVQIIGVSFPEERAHRDGNEHDGWIFIHRARRPMQRISGKKVQPATAPQSALVRAHYVGRSDLSTRTPELASFNSKHVAIFGLGAVGGFVAEHLARAGVGTLTLVDHDFVDAATFPRHTATLHQAGRPKPHAVAERARLHNPFVNTIPAVWKLGSVREDGAGESERDFLQRTLSTVDLIIDATAARTPTLMLARAAAENGVPLLEASATNGAWGGRVVRIMQATPGCYACLLHHLTDEDRAEDEGERKYSALAAPLGDVQPVGCAEPTFTGSGFDIAEVSVFASRLAVSTLLSGREDTYPAFSGDVFVLALRDEKGDAIPPYWVARALERHPNCKAH